MFKNFIAIYFLFSGHYDSKISPKGFLGATDSAVPCAQMLNLAHTMQMDLDDQKRSESELTLQFLFLDGEEAFKTWNHKDRYFYAFHEKNVTGKYIYFNKKCIFFYIVFMEQDIWLQN